MSVTFSTSDRCDDHSKTPMDIELERLDRLGGSKRGSVGSLGKDEEAQGFGSGSGKESSQATSNYSRVDEEEALVS